MEKPKVLHFEQDQFLSKVYGEKFKVYGFDYVNYENPSKDVTSVVIKENPDIIIMALLMAVMDGFEAIEILKKDSRTKNIPIIGLSNLSDIEDVKRLYDLGAEEYILLCNAMPLDLVGFIKNYFVKNNKFKENDFKEEADFEPKEIQGEFKRLRGKMV